MFAEVPIALSVISGGHENAALITVFVTAGEIMLEVFGLDSENPYPPERQRKDCCPSRLSAELFLTGLLLLLVCFFGVRPARASTHTFDFGAAPTGSIMNHAFIIANHSKKVLQIRSVQAYCNSVQVISYPVEIAPQGKGRLEVRWQSLEPGKTNCKIEVATKRPVASLIDYRITGRAKGQNTAASSGIESRIYSDLVTRKITKPDRSLIISSRSVHQSLKKGRRLTLVDVRNKKDFNRFRIPGSINIPLFAIKTKGYLKSARVVLINDGYGLEQLEDECRALRAAGFCAYILEGGLARWKQKNYKLAGNAIAQLDPNKISARAFYQDKNFDNWLVLNATVKDRKISSYIIPWGIAVAGPHHPEMFLKQIEKMKKEHKNTPFLTFVVFDDNGTSYGKLERAIGEAGISDVFFLKGGFAAYRTYLTRQTALLENLVHPKKVIRRCPNCPQRNQS